jgi:hypothetical protein
MKDLLISIGFEKITDELYQYKKQDKIIEFDVKSESFTYFDNNAQTELKISSTNELITFIKVVLNTEIRINKNVISTKEICAWLSNEICTLLDLKYYEFIGDTKKLKSLNMKTRSRFAVLGRQIFSHIIKSDELMTFEEIGQYLSNRDHSTIIHSKNEIDNCISIKDDRYDKYKIIKDRYDAFMQKSIIIEDKNELENELSSLRLHNITIQQYIHSKIKELTEAKTNDRDRLIANNSAIFVYKDLNKEFFT